MVNNRSREWVKILPSNITKLNEQKTALTNMASKQAIKQSTVETLLPNYKFPVSPNEKLIDLESIVRYLYEPGELEGCGKKRATDPIWSIDAYEIDRVIEIEGQPVLHFLREFNGYQPPRRSFVKEELQIIPRNTGNPP